MSHFKYHHFTDSLLYSHEFVGIKTMRSYTRLEAIFGLAAKKCHSVILAFDIVRQQLSSDHTLLHQDALANALNM